MKLLFVVLVIAFAAVSQACSDIYMNFTNYRLSTRSMDLGTQMNWTITTWPKKIRSGTPLKNDPPSAFWPVKYGSVGISGNWFTDEHYGFPSFFADSLNEQGLSCSLLMLVGTKYQKRSDDKTNVFAGLFCHYVAQTFESVLDLQQALPNIAIYGPDALSQHFVIRDSTGASLIVECINGEQRVYLDKNDNVDGFGIMTNEPTFDWHLEHIKHYQWKRTLARQAVAIPGNFYPEERFLRAYMMKEGQQAMGLTSTTDFQHAFAFTVQVLNTVSVPMGNQYGTDSGDSGNSEGDGDHTVWGIVRDHKDPTIYWRDATNPTFRRLALKDVDLSLRGQQKSLLLESGPYFVNMVDNFQ
jgi:choloylglycine hydrolase